MHILLWGNCGHKMCAKGVNADHLHGGSARTDAASHERSREEVSACQRGELHPLPCVVHGRTVIAAQRPARGDASLRTVAASAQSPHPLGLANARGTTALRISKFRAAARAPRNAGSGLRAVWVVQAGAIYALSYRVAQLRSMLEVSCAEGKVVAHANPHGSTTPCRPSNCVSPAPPRRRTCELFLQFHCARRCHDLSCS